MSRTYCSENGQAYELCREIAWASAQRLCSFNDEDKIDNFSYKFDSAFREIYPFPEEDFIHLSEGFCAWLQSELGDIFSPSMDIKGDRRLQLLKGLRQLYCRIKSDPTLEIMLLIPMPRQKKLIFNYASPSMMEELINLGEFIAKHEIIYYKW